MTARLVYTLVMALVTLAFGWCCSRLPERKMAKAGRERAVAGCIAMCAAWLLFALRTFLHSAGVAGSSFFLFVIGAGSGLLGVGLLLWGLFSSFGVRASEDAPAATMHRRLSLFYLALTLLPLPFLRGILSAIAVGRPSERALFGETVIVLFRNQTILLAAAAIGAILLLHVTGRVRWMAENKAAIVGVPVALALLAMVQLMPKLLIIRGLASSHRIWPGDARPLVWDVLFFTLLPWFMTLFAWHMLLGIAPPRDRGRRWSTSPLAPEKRGLE